MGNQAWTPGPWKACRSHEGYEGPYWDIESDEKAEYDAKPFTAIKAANGDTVANAHDLFEFKAEDARLIAAAPDLLAALIDARKRLHGAGMLGAGDVVTVAIARAKGAAQ